MRVKIHLNKLFLKQKFTISHGSYDYRQQLIVELSDKGQAGFGETVAIDYYGYTIAGLEKEAHAVIPYFTSFSSESSYKSFYNTLKKLLPSNPFLRAAFDEAYIDLQSKLNNKSIRNFLNINSNYEVNSSITIGLSDSLSSVEKKLEEAWPFYKIKVNAENFRENIMKMIRDSGNSFGIDANGSLDLGQAQNAINLTQKYEGVYVEQLVHKQWTTEIDQLCFPENIIHLADESVTDLESAKKLINHYDGFVLKLTKCGGITPILEIISYAKSKGKKLLAGCMTESSIGINHMVQLLPFFDFADLDGAYLISNDQDILQIDSHPKRQLQKTGKFK